jgi:hypothetical protein
MGKLGICGKGWRVGKKKLRVMTTICFAEY